MKYDQTFNLSHSVMGPDNLFGVSNYYLPIYGENTGNYRLIIDLRVFGFLVFTATVYRSFIVILPIVLIHGSYPYIKSLLY